MATGALLQLPRPGYGRSLWQRPSGNLRGRAFQGNAGVFPRAYGHTIVLYKPHREDISELSENEAAKVFQMCVRVVKAIKQGLGAEKVYLNTMCDGGINHLHLQLFPRYAGEPIGSKRFVAPRGPLVKADEIVAAIRAGLIS